jgi:uncharacterized membrane protein
MQTSPIVILSEFFEFLVKNTKFWRSLALKVVIDQLSIFSKIRQMSKKRALLHCKVTIVEYNS